ncbi:MAG: aminotransferase class I/II-fold pyridoxal phosphate-dependent enzyme, partial [Bacteroidota bacterium]|nr:aminotransferase class I/II-fold pyridoxal phosphate-dependent enzyme [Bacteroidota bacterium]
DFYQQKRDTFISKLQHSLFNVLPCKGTYFVCLDYSKISDEPDKRFAEIITEQHGVACIPTSSFYHDKKDFKVLRFCFAKNEDTLLKAAERLCKI